MSKKSIRDLLRQELIALRNATLVAFPIPIRLIKLAGASPIPQAIAFCFIHSLALSLCLGVSFFESFIQILFSLLEIGNWNLEFGAKTTAPATTGPAKHPLPTSSTPATNLYPFLQSFFSKDKLGFFVCCFNVCIIIQYFP